MALSPNDFHPLAHAEAKIKELDKDLIEKVAALKDNERKTNELRKKEDKLRKEVCAIKDERKQWVEARDTLKTSLTAPAPVPQASVAPTVRAGIPCRVGIRDEDDEDSEYGDVKTGIMMPEEAAAKRKGVDGNASAKRQRTTSAAGARGDFDPERVVREVADELDDYLPRATSVVKHLTDKFIELRCCVCHTNVSDDGGSLMRGWKGMLEHLLAKHERRMERWLRGGSSAHDVVFGHCTFRQLNHEEVEKLRDGREKIELVEPQRGRPSTDNENIREVVTSLQSSKTVASGRSRTRSPRRLLVRDCFVCDTKIRADEGRLACKYCTTAIHPSCEATLVEAAHIGCRKEPEDHTMNDFELQEPSVMANN